jgi:hypothetical protein
LSAHPSPTFKYDPFGRRIEKISPTTTSIFVYEGDNLVETVNSTGGAVARYTQGQDIDESLAVQQISARATSCSDPANSLLPDLAYLVAL